MREDAMAKQIERLTAPQVAKRHARTAPALLADGDGLYFRKQTTGGKHSASTWMLRYRFAGRERWMALGNYPDVTLAEARTGAAQARKLVDKGLDPLGAKRALQAREAAKAAGDGTFANLAEDWYRQEVTGAKRPPKHPEIPRRHLDKYLLPPLRTKQAASISAMDVADIVERIARKHPTAANDVLLTARRVLNYAVRRQRIPANPVASLTPKLDGGGAERSRDRALSRDELAALFASMRGSAAFGGLNLLAVRLLLALCVRKGELFAARWPEFDLDGTTDDGPVWHLPASRTKMRQPLDIPLSPQVTEWLKALRLLASGSDFVFPARRRDKRSRAAHVGRDTLNAALSELKDKHELQPFTVHDLRRTARTLLASLGTRSEVVEMCLGHKPRGVEGTYNRHDYFEERRVALEQLSNLIGDIDSGERKVTAFRGKRRA
jgi:integrase